MRRHLKLADESQYLLRPLEEWGEDDGEVLWFRWPIQEPPHVTSPLCDDFEKREPYYTHWLPLPDCNRLRAPEER